MAKAWDISASALEACVAASAAFGSAATALVISATVMGVVGAAGSATAGIGG